MRTILLIIAIGIGYLIIKQLLKGKQTPSKPRVINADMVKCQHCDLHIPEIDAVKSDGRSYCSTEHRDLDKRN